MRFTAKLPGISNIYILKTADLPDDVAFREQSGMVLALAAPMMEIEFHGDAECEHISDFQDNGHFESVTLTFHTHERIKMGQKSAFVVIDVNGVSYLIGAKEAPFPIVKKTRLTGTPSGEPNDYVIEVAHTAIRTLVECYF